LVGSNPRRIITEFERACRNDGKPKPAPHFWDGNAATRIIKVLVDDFALSDISP
jgi:UDP-N-acetylglucosamine 2-epimerase (non-hydrolysing)